MTVLLMIFSMLPSHAFSAGAKPDVALEVTAGYDGIAKLGTYVPYKILVINKGGAVDGEVQIEVKIDSYNKTIFAKPVSLAEGASKEVVISAPVFTARRGVKIRFSSNGKTVRELDYSFRRLLPPEVKTIGVLSGDNSAYDYLNGIMIPWRVDSDHEEKLKAMMAAGVYPASSVVTVDSVELTQVKEVESVLVPLSSEEFPEKPEEMSGFDILIISNFDTSLLTKDQLQTLDNWVKNGGTLVVGTGVNWKKVYNLLPENLKKFAVTGTTQLNVIAELAGFIDAKYEGDLTIGTVTGELGFKYQEPEERSQETEEDSADTAASKEKLLKPSLSIDEVICGNGENPLAVKYIYNLGRILFLAFDPGMEPFAGWEGKNLFWEKLLYHASTMESTYQRGAQYYYSNYNNSDYYLNSLATEVPEEKKAPLAFMFVTLLIYIILVGPLMYIILKRKDKRDYTWVAVPAVAVLTLVVIYFAGFRTRYRSAVFNTVSVIRLDYENKMTDITTGMGIFNNKRGDLRLSFSQDDNISFDVTQGLNRSFVSYPDGSEPEGVVASKLTLSEPAVYELYNVYMWEPKYISAKKSEPLPEQIINSVSITDGKVRIVINNTTKYDFLDAFISLGNNFISAGDILAGEQKTIEQSLDSEEVYHSITEYLDSKYGRLNYYAGGKPPENYSKNRRIRSLLENLHARSVPMSQSRPVIGLYALNYQDMGYDIKINGATPESFYTNGIYATMPVNFEKGQEADIPEGVILPDTTGFEMLYPFVYLDGEIGMTPTDIGDVDLTYRIPEEIELREFSLEFSTYIPLYTKYYIEEMKNKDSNFQHTILQNKYEYYIYNNRTESWIKVDKSHTQKDDVEDFLDDENRLKVRISIVEIADRDIRAGYTETERIMFPGLRLKGVVK